MMLGARTAAWSGKPLPYDAEVEYLESTGTQYIDTGVLANGEFDVEYTIQTPSSADFTSQFMVGGARSASQHLNLGQYEPNGRFTLGFLGKYWVAATSVIAANTRYTVKIHYAYGSQTATINGTNATSSTLTGTEALNLNVYLFKRNFYGASDTIPPMKGRMYALKMWRDGVLVGDFIPVRRGNVGYLYDRVSGELFGNAGTGAFVIGPDKTT